MGAAGKKLHHLVPRFYLDAWTVNSKMWCLRRNEIFQTNVRNVAAENHFYRLQELRPSDVIFIREAVIDDSPERLKSMHERLLQQFLVPHAAKAYYRSQPTTSPKLLSAIERDIAEANENFHTSIEESFQPYLARLRNGDLSFLSSDTDMVLFYRGLSVQYMRTNHRRRIELLMPAENRAIYDRTANILTHILAVNIGYSLFNDHPRFRFVLIENHTDVPFVTTDQPVINVAANLKELAPPAAFEVYYPVSPKRALLILEPNSDFLPRTLSISPLEAYMWNLRIASRAYRQVFSTESKQLEIINADLPGYINSL